MVLNYPVKVLNFPEAVRFSVLVKSLWKCAGTRHVMASLLSSPRRDSES